MSTLIPFGRRPMREGHGVGQTRCLHRIDTESRELGQREHDTPGPDTAPARLVLSPKAALAVVALIGILAGPVAAATRVPDTGMSDLAVSHALAFFAFTVAWSPIQRWRGGLLHVAGLVAVVSLTLGELLAGQSAWPALSSALAATVTGGVAGWVVTRGRTDVSWIPRDPPESIRMLSAAALASLVGLWLGAFPGAPFGGSGHVGMDLWVGGRGFGVLAVTMSSFIPLWFRPDVVASRVLLPRLFPALVVVTVVCLAIPFAHPEVSLSWIALAPALWAGLTLTPRRVAAFTLGMALALSFAPSPPIHEIEVYLLPVGLGRDLLIACVTIAALQISVMREQAARMGAVVRDRAEDESRQHALLTGISDAMNDGLVVTDADGRVLMHNRAAEDMLGELPEHIEATDAPDPDGPGGGESVEHGHDLVRAALLQHRDVDRVLHALDLTVTQPQRHVRVTSRRLDVDGDARHVLIVRDVTREHARQKELESFAGTVAHDLKGPLTGLRGWLEFAREELAEGDPDAAVMAVGRAREATGRMTALVEDMLAYTVTQDGSLRLVPVRLDEVVTDLETLYEGTGATLRHDTAHTVHADPALVRQLLANLIGNSIKYTRPGEPAYVEVASYDGPPGWVEIEVSDKGRGLQPGDEEKIFAAFGRSSKDAESVQGIGLGLSLCHAIVTRHGGAIGAENNEWGGATFMMTLPVSS
ncbi:MAG: ATP-binding protein [Mobilicoccus sp.]|nr:ATP-binding protein [Mobilicoccus sp.]